MGEDFCACLASMLMAASEMGQPHGSMASHPALGISPGLQGGVLGELLAWSESPGAANRGQGLAQGTPTPVSIIAGPQRSLVTLWRLGVAWDLGEPWIGRADGGIGGCRSGVTINPQQEDSFPWEDGVCSLQVGSWGWAGPMTVAQWGLG